jgi:hypothetical protein
MRRMQRRFVLATLCALALGVMGVPMASAQQTDELQQVTSDTSAAVIGFMLHFNTLAKGEIEGLYKH